MIGMNERTEIIRGLIKRRVTNYHFVGDLSLSQVYALDMTMVWGSPEGTIFNIFNSYFRDLRLGKSESQIIQELEREDGNSNISSLPNDINGYIKLRLRREFPMIAHLYNDSIFIDYKTIIKKEMGYDSEVKAQNVYTGNSTTNSKQKKEGCYIATSCYGSYDTPELLVFRKYRDTVLKKNIFGRIFIQLYYITSPFLVKKIGNHKLTTNFIRKYLDKIYNSLRDKA